MNEQKRKLTDDQVAMMRSQAAHHVPHRELSKRFGVAQAQVSRIVRGEIYIDSPGPLTHAKLTHDNPDPMGWYARQGLSWAEARTRYRLLQRQRRRRSA